MATIIFIEENKNNKQQEIIFLEKVLPILNIILLKINDQKFNLMNLN